MKLKQSKIPIKDCNGIM